MRGLIGIEDMVLRLSSCKADGALRALLRHAARIRAASDSHPPAMKPSVLREGSPFTCRPLLTRNGLLPRSEHGKLPAIRPFVP